jgi:GT2 family glycosyltransferase
VTNTIANTTEFTGSYEQALVGSDWLKRIPFEHTTRSVPHDHFIRRLLQERGLFLGGSVSAVFPVNLAILVDGDPTNFQRTLESCFLQSAHEFTISVISRDTIILKEAQDYCRYRLARDAFLRQNFDARISYCESIYDLLRSPATYIVVIRSGDVAHLSCVTSIYLELTRTPAADVFLWNEMHVAFRTDSILRRMRKPKLEPYTLFHFNYVGESFAFRSTFLSWFSEIDRCFADHDLHYFLLAILQKGSRRFVTIPQYLILRDIENVKPHSARSRVSAYRDYFSDLGFTLKLAEDSSGYTVSPKRRAAKISVIIPFRNQPEITCRAVESVINQETDADLELILIDNQSNPTACKPVCDFLKLVESSRRNIQLLQYNKPFNHSAQCNLGAREARGECLVFLNNDAHFLTRNALAEMAAWSLVSDVGTVGARMFQDIDGKSLSAGITARLVVGSEFHSPVQESQEIEFASFNRETWGNSFACAAISKKKFDMVGPLDEVDFPNGYNDVDYSIRCRKAGLVNIYLGTVCVYHKPGRSRGRYDEIHQKIVLRQKFPEIFSDGLFQLSLQDCSYPKPES